MQTAAQAPGAPAPASDPPRIVFDLIENAGREERTLEARRGEFFFLVIGNRAPSGTYRVSHDWLIAPATKSRPPAGALKKSQELQKPFDSALRALPLGPPCDELQASAHAVLRVTEEGQLPEALAPFRAKLAADGCPRLRYIGTLVQQLVDAEVQGYTLYEGDVLRIVVERLDPASGQTVATWRLAVQAEPGRLQWVHANEEAWVVAETSRDIVEMLMYARDQSVPADAALGFSAARDETSEALHAVTFTLRPGETQRHALRLDPHIWSPASYEALARDVVRRLALRPARASSPDPVLDALLDPRPEVLVRHSVRISALLAAQTLDAGAHEQAALVLGALALRESAGELSDIRQTLCRMTSHLALARALRDDESAREGYADALLLTLVNRQQDALALIETLGTSRSAPAWRPFLRALYVRNTRDWRILERSPGTTLLEHLEQYRALQASLGASRALAFHDGLDQPSLTEWGRVAAQHHPSIEQSHVLLGDLVDLDLRNASEIWRLIHGEALPEDRLLRELVAPTQRALAREPRADAPLQVIGWGIWAHFFQRHLAFDAQADARVQDDLGLKEQARRVRAALDVRLSRLDLWPVVRLGWTRWAGQDDETDAGQGPQGDAARRDACERAVALAQARPELLTAAAWRRFDHRCFEARQDQSLPEMARWFVVAVPQGTVLLEMDRLIVGPGSRPGWRQLHELAPFHRLVLHALAPDDEPRSVAELTALFGPLLEYDIVAMRRVAIEQRGDAEALHRAFTKIAALEPEWNVELGEHLLDLDREEAAAAAYEAAIAKSRDRALVSNHVGWLVGYYCDRGDVARARAVAEWAAEAYSGGGLATMAYLHERLGEYEQAEAWHRKVQERYGNRSSSENFYIRHEHRVADGRFKTAAAAALRAVFPSGLERVSLADFAAALAPGDGVSIEARALRTRRFGLVKGDVVVALNGYRVRNDRQYALLWTLDDDPEATAIAWREGRYVEVKGRLKRTSHRKVVAAATR